MKFKRYEYIINKYLRTYKTPSSMPAYRYAVARRAVYLDFIRTDWKTEFNARLVTMDRDDRFLTINDAVLWIRAEIADTHDQIEWHTRPAAAHGVQLDYICGYYCTYLSMGPDIVQ